ncbi:MAG: M23 family metallopeptidase [Clostridia bacterium]|nr:M23 family metallopeptidase [Clostridia bacterium]
MKRRVISAFCTFLFVGTIFAMLGLTTNDNKDYIKYAEFNITYNALKDTMKYDIESHDQEIKINWIDLLAYLGAKYGGDFSKYRSGDLDKVIDSLNKGEKMSDITRSMKYYRYYREVYSSVLAEYLGEKEDGTYGLKVYSPIASGFYYSDYDDFGASRTYGYKRQHLGHDLMALTGTPVIAIESGVVEVLGWNQYGGWRVGIRSNDSKRYYYYAHLRQNRPYHCDLFEGKKVNAGDVIGYVGRTGYSSTENTNGIESSHLHFGVQLIFDESQKEGNNEIWINLYSLTKLLSEHQSTVIRNSETKEFYSESQSKIENN